MVMNCAICEADLQRVKNLRAWLSKPNVLGAKYNCKDRAHGPEVRARARAANFEAAAA